MVILGMELLDVFFEQMLFPGGRGGQGKEYCRVRRCIGCWLVPGCPAIVLVCISVNVAKY